VFGDTANSSNVAPVLWLERLIEFFQSPPLPQRNCKLLGFQSVLFLSFLYVSSFFAGKLQGFVIAAFA
jgi:hypothetical protein